MMTSTYPSDNGIVRHVGIPLSCGFRLLAEELQDAGYSTHAVVANGALGREFHFDQGFDTYVETWKEKVQPGEPDPSEARGVNRFVIGVAETIDPDRPYFLWVHYLDPHFPYAAPEPWRDRFVGDEHYDPTVRLEIADQPRREMLELGFQQVLDGHDELDFYRARYDGEIAYTDAQIGALLEHLGAQGLLEETLLVVTSDHGESLGEHHYLFDHGRFGFETCLRVPLLFHYPGVITPQVDTAPVELLDVAPTLLAFAGVRLREGERWMRGRSLLPRLVTGGGAPADSDLAHAEAGYGQNRGWQRTVSDGRFKMIYAQKPQAQQWIGGRGTFFTLYDLDADPGETADVAGQHPETFERLRDALWTLRESPPMRVEREDERCVTEGPMDEETRRQLEALGYL